MLKYIPGLILLLATITLHAQVSLEKQLQTFNEYQDSNPVFKIYMSHDKPAYVAGETIWLSTFLVDGSLHQLNALSQTVYAELLDSQGQTIDKIMLNTPLGMGAGNILLPDSLPSGNYILRAYNNYMRNEGAEYFFHKTIPVISPESPSTGEEITEKPDLQFFPEGGTFLIGVDNRVAFKAVGTDGLPVAVSGNILDEKKEIVTTFASSHDGMGRVTLTPSPGKSYTAILDEYPDTVYTLPAVLFSGYSIQVTDDGHFFRARVYRNTSADPGNIQIIVQSRGIIRYAAEATITNSSAIRIPKDKLPTGISQITIFDEYGTPQCERLVFINHDDQLGIAVESNKPSYEEREKVKLKIKFQTSGQDTLDAVCSVTVYDKSKVPGTEGFGMDITNYLLLSSDLKGHIFNPGYYFQPSDSLVLAHADLLMLTQGWRRFTWQDIAERRGTISRFTHERGIPIRGKVTRAMSKKGIQDAQIKILNINSGGLVLSETDENGEFFNDELVFYDSAELVIQTDNRKGRQTEYSLIVDPPVQDLPLSYNMPWYAYSNPELLEQARNRMRIEDGYTTEDDVIMLEEVAITASKKREKVTRMYGSPDRTITTEKLPLMPVNILDALRGRFAGVQISGSPINPTISIRGGGEPLFLLDGIQVPKESILNIAPSTIGQIDLIKGNAAAIYGSNGANGVIAFYTKIGYEGNPYPTYGMNTQWYPGYHSGRVFYSPAYDIPSDRHNLPDERTTLFWEPIARPDSNGNLEIEFFTADESSEYIVRVEGITFEGAPGTGIAEFQVAK